MLTSVAEDVAALWTARSSDELHQVLVLEPPARHAPDPSEPLGLLRQHHESEPDSSFDTAFLLLTDQRWRGATGALARRLGDTDILTSVEIDELARSFVAADDALYWTVPDAWLSGGVEIDVGRTKARGGRRVGRRRRPTFARRQVCPAPRRWGAFRLATRDPQRAEWLLTRPAEVDARSGAAIVAGLLDGFDFLPERARRTVLDVAAQWPSGMVRKRAIALIAERDGADVARALASGDRDASIRRWAPSLVATLPMPDPAGQEAVDEAGDALVLF